MPQAEAAEPGAQVGSAGSGTIQSVASRGTDSQATPVSGFPAWRAGRCAQQDVARKAFLEKRVSELESGLAGRREEWPGEEQGGTASGSRRPPDGKHSGKAGGSEGDFGREVTAIAGGVEM